MKKIVLLLGISLFTTILHAQQKDISGLWQGKLNAGIELRIVFHFTKNTDGSYSATMDSPDQNVKDIPVTSVDLAGDSVIAGIKLINGSYQGVTTNDSVITGKWVQNGANFPLVIQRIKAIAELNRPQTPKPPFAYNNEEVEYDNADKSVHFGGSFTYPKTSGTFATVLLITGSGQQDRDETILLHKPFAVIADYLTNKGYAVLRVDDRGMGETTGEAIKATSADFANDVEAGINYLKTRKEVDKTKIGLIGHSEGGIIAPMVAARNKDVAFIILLAGPGIKGIDLLTEQNKAILLSGGVSDKAADAYMPLFRKIAEIAIAAKDTSVSRPQAWNSYLEWKKATDPSLVKELKIDDVQKTQPVIATLVNTFSMPWMSYFLSYDPAPALQKLSIKVLALNGSKDIQVLPASNMAGIKAALAKSKTKNYTVTQLDGLNHLFQHCKTCSIPEYGQLEESFAPEALAVMGKWLDENVK